MKLKGRVIITRSGFKTTSSTHLNPRLLEFLSSTTLANNPSRGRLYGKEEKSPCNSRDPVVASR